MSCHVNLAKKQSLTVSIAVVLLVLAGAGAQEVIYQTKPGDGEIAGGSCATYRFHNQPNSGFETTVFNFTFSSMTGDDVCNESNILSQIR